MMHVYSEIRAYATCAEAGASLNHANICTLSLVAITNSVHFATSKVKALRNCVFHSEFPIHIYEYTYEKCVSIK